MNWENVLKLAEFDTPTVANGLEMLGVQDPSVGYTGPEEGIPVPLKRGQAAIFSSLLLHSSGPNTTDGPRRAYVIQYAPTHAINPRSGEPWGDCLPVAKNGQPLFAE